MNKTLNYFKKQVDDQGIIQFSNGVYKDYRFGYAIEDQARALLVTLSLNDEDLTKLFVSLIEKSIDPKGVKMLWDSKGKFKNLVDNFGEASAEVVWALGHYLTQYSDPKAKNIYNSLINGVGQSQFPRVWAYALLGTTKIKDDQATQILAEKIIQQFNQYSDKDWFWFEDKMTYGNALFPFSLLESYKLFNNPQYKTIGLISLNFLLDNFIYDSFPIVVGNKGWWKKGSDFPLYDQQPIDFSYMVLACISAYNITAENYYLDKALFYYSWFFGNNLQQIKMIRSDGACYDGLNKYGPNINAGAESTVCFMLATLALQPYITHSASNSYISPTI